MGRDRSTGCPEPGHRLCRSTDDRRLSVQGPPRAARRHSPLDAPPRSPMPASDRPRRACEPTRRLWRAPAAASRTDWPGAHRLFRAAGGRAYFNTEKTGEGHGGPRSRAHGSASLPPARCLSCPLPLAFAMASHREAPHQGASHRGASWRRTRPKRRDTLRGPPWPSPSSSVVKNETDRAPEAPASGHPGARPAPPRRPALPRPGDRPCAGSARSRAAGSAARRDVSPARLTRS